MHQQNQCAARSVKGGYHKHLPMRDCFPAEDTCSPAEVTLLDAGDSWLSFQLVLWKEVPT